MRQPVTNSQQMFITGYWGNKRFIHNQYLNFKKERIFMS
jgi:hypothetical protein